MPKAVKRWLNDFENGTFDKVDELTQRFLFLNDNDQYLVMVNLWYELRKLKKK